jgi:nickel transport protein
VIRPLAVAATLLAPLAAAAHEVSHEVVRGGAVAVRVRYADGDPMRYAEYQLFAPSDARIPHQKGRTDRAGWVAFVPVEPGAWRLKVADASGHGLDVEIPVESARPAPGAAAAPSGALAWVLRPLGGVLAVGAVFAALIAVHRLRRSTR